MVLHFSSSLLRMKFYELVRFRHLQFNVVFRMTPERMITTTCSVSLNLTTKIKENSLYHNYLDEQEMLRLLSLQSTFLYQSMGPNSLRSKKIFSLFFQSQQAINIHLCKVIQMNISKVTCIISRISQQCQHSSEDCRGVRGAWGRSRRQQ